MTVAFHRYIQSYYCFNLKAVFCVVAYPGNRHYFCAGIIWNIVRRRSVCMAGIDIKRG